MTFSSIIYGRLKPEKEEEDQHDPLADKGDLLELCPSFVCLLRRGEENTFYGPIFSPFPLLNTAH